MAERESFHSGHTYSATGERYTPTMSQEYALNDLEEPTLPWMDDERRWSRGSLAVSEADAGSLHIVKRLPDAPRTGPERWTRYKWWLLLANTMLFAYGIGGVVCALLTWFKLYLRADVIIVGERLILNLLTAASVFCLFSAFVGYAGILLNNRKILTVYNMLLWPCFSLILAIGYVAYRNAKWNLEAKLSFQWHRVFSPSDRQRIQANLHCCGYKTFDDYSERSSRCFPRTLLPGCKFKYQTWTTQGLFITWVCAFSIVPIHIFVIFSALLCSNHVSKTFGKSLPPKMYFLSFQREIKRSNKTFSILGVRNSMMRLSRDFRDR
ncbi:uncharacterized protein VTP21DRAFT_6432 [Calcarisporiella thermophila]|uniref:uncharacterized protein n=1 Tax=Calcarisporiella thermophila TaxID=911321 RepID=UPI0037438011